MKHKEKTFKGLGVSPGIGIGVAHVRESGAIEVPTYPIPARQVDKECARLEAAVTRARRQIGQLRTKARGMSGTVAEELVSLLDAYFHMLKDSRLVRGARRRITGDHINAEAASRPWTTPKSRREWKTSGHWPPVWCATSPRRP